MLHTFQSSTMCLRALITLRVVGFFLILVFFFFIWLVWGFGQCGLVCGFFSWFCFNV